MPAGGVCFAFAELDPSESVFQRGDSCYVYGRGAKKWRSAEGRCEALGGHLTCLNDQTEASFIVDTVLGLMGLDPIAAPSSFFIGLNHRGNEGAFDWADPDCCSNYRKWDVSRHTDANTGSTTVTRQAVERTRALACVTANVYAGVHNLYSVDCGIAHAYVCEAHAQQSAVACATCGAGLFARKGAATCETCPFGSYSSSAGSSACEACPRWSPAGVLTGLFGRTTATSGGSLHCGGNLGRAQRAAYFLDSTLGLVVAAVLGAGAAFLPWSVAKAMDRHVRARSADFYRKAGCSIGWTASVTLALASVSFAVFLQPLRQESKNWPFRGRPRPTTGAICNFVGL